MPSMEQKRPHRMKGRRRPNVLLHRSLKDPTMGATMRPDKGPTIQTAWLSTGPAPKPFSKYGVVKVNLMTIISTEGENKVTYDVWKGLEAEGELMTYLSVDRYLERVGKETSFERNSIYV